MAFDIIGPANAPNSTTARPADDRAFGSSDTWFKDCSSSVANDGTKLKASFMNAVSGAFRSLIRGNGNTALAAPIVAEDNADDGMALKAIQHLIQRGQTEYAVDAGIANALAVSLTPAIAEYKAGMIIRVKVAVTNTGASTINVNSKGVKQIYRPDMAAIGAADMVAGMIVMLVYDGVGFQLVGVQPNILTAPRSFYVNATIGNDGNDGLTSVTPFLTIQRALAVSATFNLNGFDVTINVANGSYTGPNELPQVNGSGKVNIVGNTVTPSSVIVSTSTKQCFFGGGGRYSIRGFAMQNSSSGSGHLIWSYNSCTIDVSDNEYGSASSGNHIFASDGGTIVVAGAVRISGSAVSHMFAQVGSRIILNPSQPPSLTILASVSFSLTFWGAYLLGAVIGTYSSITNPGSVTASKFYGTTNSVISVNGAGTNYLPGSSGGVVTSGAQYA